LGAKPDSANIANAASIHESSLISSSGAVAIDITLDDGILVDEAVHVEQYRQLGIQRFVELYVTSSLHSGGYQGIPLEANA
jgi:hypothetical protein